ncbi:MAG: hypothetical protein GTN99_05220 [Candidatus Dadabacteria bacterium]|nr:hypothetical protein [Candidatus Dadabacteria bacterium]NIT13646.1 hypothetical protein [Candidatus Dadabacteria bacterium]
MEILGDNIYIQILQGIIFGLLLGLIPLFIARKRGHTQIGIWAVILCSIASSFFGPLPALPIAAIFTMVASLKEHEKIKD